MFIVCNELSYCFECGLCERVNPCDYCIQCGYCKEKIKKYFEKQIEILIFGNTENWNVINYNDKTKKAKKRSFTTCNSCYSCGKCERLSYIEEEVY